MSYGRNFGSPYLLACRTSRVQKLLIFKCFLAYFATWVFVVFPHTCDGVHPPRVQSTRVAITKLSSVLSL